MKFLTEKDLQKAIEKKIGYKLSNDDWKYYAPNWDPPYDNSDLTEIVRHIPHVKPGKPDMFKAAYVRSGLIPQSVNELVTKARLDLFGNAEPPFKDINTMRAWIMREAESQPPAEGHAPRYGYRMESGTSFDELLELNKERPGVYGLEFALLALPSGDNRFTSYVIVSDGTSLRKVWLTVRFVAERLDCQEAQATVYILTGIKPLVAPITIEPQSTFYTDGPNRGKIVLTIREPLPTENILAVYKEVREQLWGHKHNHQIPNDKDCALVDFIQPRLNPDKPEWDSLRIEWNREYADWAFDNWRYLKITYERAKEKIYPAINFGPVTVKN